MPTHAVCRVLALLSCSHVIGPFFFESFRKAGCSLTRLSAYFDVEWAFCCLLVLELFTGDSFV